MQLAHHLRQHRFIINIIITGDLAGVVAVLLDDLREIVVHGIKLKLLIMASGDRLFQD